MRKCSVPDCGRKHDALGYCFMHWRRMRLWGTTEYRSTIRREPERTVVDAQPLRDYLKRCGTPMMFIGVVSTAAYRQVYRVGRISYGDADAIACALGVHPSDIWGSAWWEAA